MSFNEHALPYVVLLLFASAPGSQLCIISYVQIFKPKRTSTKSGYGGMDILTQNYEMVNLFIEHIKVFNEFRGTERQTVCVCVFVSSSASDETGFE